MTACKLLATSDFAILSSCFLDSLFQRFACSNVYLKGILEGVGIMNSKLIVMLSVMVTCSSWIEVGQFSLLKHISRIPNPVIKNARSFNRPFSISQSQRGVADDIKKQTEELHSLVEKLDKHAFAIGDFFKGSEYRKNKMKAFGNNFQLIDTEFFPRYLTGALGGATVFLAGPRYMAGAPKRDIQKLYELDRRLQDTQNILTPEERYKLQNQVDMLRLTYLQEHGEETLKKQMATMAAIEQLKKKMNDDQQGGTAAQTSHPQDLAKNQTNTTAKSRVTSTASVTQPQGWFGWGLNSLYTGSSYALYPFARAGNWVYARLFSQSQQQ